MRNTFIIPLCVVIPGCAATGESFAPTSASEKDKALVYVYRSSDYNCQRPADPSFFYINDKRVFIFRCNVHSILKLNPGSYRFSIKKNMFYLPGYEMKGAQVYSFEEGKTYYIRYREDYAFTDTVAGRAIDMTNATFTILEGPTPPLDISKTSYVEPGASSFD